MTKILRFSNLQYLVLTNVQPGWIIQKCKGKKISFGWGCNLYYTVQYCCYSDGSVKLGWVDKMQILDSGPVHLESGSLDL